MPRAWGYVGGEPWLLNPRRVRKIRRNVAGNPRRRRNPFGETAVILGAGNPRRRRTHRITKGGSTVARRKRGSHRHRRYNVNPHRRRRSVRSIVRYHRRGVRRRNPARAATTFRTVQSALPLMGTGAVAMIATVSAPALFGTRDVTYAYLAQASMAVGGYFVLPWVGLRGMHPIIWLIVSGSTILGDVVGKYLTRAVPGLAEHRQPGLAEYRHPGLAQSYWPPTLTPFYRTGMRRV